MTLTISEEVAHGIRECGHIFWKIRGQLARHEYADAEQGLSCAISLLEAIERRIKADAPTTPNGWQVRIRPVTPTS